MPEFLEEGVEEIILLPWTSHLDSLETQALGMEEQGAGMRDGGQPGSQGGNKWKRAHASWQIFLCITHTWGRTHVQKLWLNHCFCYGPRSTPPVWRRCSFFQSPGLSANLVLRKRNSSFQFFFQITESLSVTPDPFWTCPGHQALLGVCFLLSWGKKTWWELYMFLEQVLSCCWHVPRHSVQNVFLSLVESPWNTRELWSRHPPRHPQHPPLNFRESET